MAPRPDWNRLVRDHARRTGADDLPAGAIAELAAHLEDLYLAARQAGASDADARARAMRMLEESALTAITAQPHRRFQRPAVAGPSPFLSASPMGLNMMSTSLWHALRLAVRQFVHQRTFAVLTVAVLGLGIGASVAVYSVVDAVLLRPLPYASPDRLVMLWDTNREKSLQHEPISPVTFMDYRTLTAFSDAAAWWRPDVNLTDPGLDPVRVKAIETSANLFALLGVKAAVGPGFPDGGPFFNPDLQAVISDRLWRTRYQADPSIVGRQLSLSDRQYTIVGVMPPRFDFPGDIDVWERLRWDLHLHSRAAHFMEGVARLAPGVTLPAADAALSGLTARLATDFPATNRVWGVRLIPLLDDMLGYYRAALIVVVGAVGLLLLIACLNVASLLLTRAIARDREISVRTALGATPRHLVIQLLAEGAVLSAAGAIAGVLTAALALPLIISTAPASIPRLADVSLNPRVLGAALALAIGTTMFFGLVPVALLRKRALTAGLRSGERGSSRGSARLYRVLVAGEVALAAALLASSALLVRTVAHMTEVPIGVTRDRAVTANVQLSGAGYQDWAVVSQTYDTLLAAIRQHPGVHSAGASNFLPLDPGWRIPFGVEGQPPARANEAPLAQYHSVTEGYFETFGARLVSGRFITARDTADVPGVVVVNETFAKRYLPGQPAVGSHLTTTSKAIGPLGINLVADGRLEVVGLVADVRNVPFGQPVEPAMYFSARQYPFKSMVLAVDAAERATAVAAIQSALRDTAPTTPAAEVGTWGDRLRARSAEPRLLMTLLAFFAVLAAGLAALGVYGLFSWSVALRQRELAIRITLGARPAGVGAGIIRQAMLLIAVGLAGGWLLIRIAEQALSRVLFEVTPSDPGSLAAAGGLLLAASLAASLPAAWRAMRVDPVEGLRAE
jgi:putative ABC transport system permease protein